MAGEKSTSEKIRILKSPDYRTTRWDGGITREICLVPEEADYRERNFRVRISSAVIEKEESDFTYLPGVHRFLMMQEGEARLVFEDGSEILLEPFDVYEFEGDTKIRCYGTGTDLNLMLKSGAEGKMFCRKCRTGDSIQLLPEEDIHRAVYIVQGTAFLPAGTALSGDTIMIPEGMEVSVKNEQLSELIAAVFEWSVN